MADVRPALQQLLNAGASPRNIQHHGGTTKATVTDREGNAIGLISR